MLWGPGAGTTEAQAPRASALQQEAPTMRSLHATTREKPAQRRRPSRAKIIIINKLKLNLKNIKLKIIQGHSQKCLEVWREN